MNKMNRLLSVVLALLLTVQLLPVQAGAATEGYYTYSVSQEEAVITKCNTSISGNVTIPSTLGGYPVTGIGYRAFYNCKSITSLTIPDSVTSLGNDAFQYCTGMTGVKLGKGITAISEIAFYGCTGLKSVTIPDSVTVIGKNAFYNCTNLTTVDLGNGLTTISNQAFYKCTGLTGLKFPSSLQSIGMFAFYHCESLRSVVIPDSVTSIGTCAFQYCVNLTSAEIGNGLTKLDAQIFENCTSLANVKLSNGITDISNYVFSGCTGLTSVKIPNGVTSIGAGVFQGCTGLESVTIPASVTNFGSSVFYQCSSLTDVYYGGTQGLWDTVIGSNKYDLGNVTLHCVTGDNIEHLVYRIENDEVMITGCQTAASGKLVIPAELEGYPVTKIDSLAFSFCSDLTSVTIPASVTGIGNHAFAGCTELTGIWVDENNPAYSSDERGVLFNKDKTQLIKAPGGISGSYTIPDSVTVMEFQAFGKCTGLTSVVIPGSVKSISESAFADCYALTDAQISEGVTDIGRAAFYNTGLTSVTIPDSVTTIEETAFSCCSDLKTVSLGKNVASIGASVFSDCTALTSVIIPESVTKISEGAFMDCTGLKDVYYVGTQEQWESIQIAAEGNAQLAAATIHYQYQETPEEGGDDPDVGGDDPDVGGDDPNPGEELLTKLLYKINNGKVTILNCDTSVTGDIVIPAQIEGCPVTQIGSWAFDNCIGITGVVIPDSVTTIGDSAFRNCTGLTSVTIPDSVTSLGQGAFADCTGLTAVTIGSGITTLGTYLFDDCTGLVDVAIPVSVTYIDGAFSGCYNLKRVYYAGTREQWDNIVLAEGEDNLPLMEARIYCNTVGIPDEANRVPECLYYQVVDGQVTITYCDPSASGQLVIPAVIEDCPVNQIGEYAFQNCTDLTGITIPASVTTIFDYAFDNCTSLTAITIPDGVTTIPNCAFRYCYALTDVDFGSGLTTIGSNAFLYCSSLNNVILPDSVTTISDFAFCGCSNLQKLDLGSGITTIGYNAFGYCSGLKGITLPESVTTICDYAFSNSGLTDIHIPDSVTSIGARAFYGTNLRSVTIPDSITEIGEYVFAMTQLSSVTIPKSVTSIGYRAFWECYVITVYYTGTQAQWDSITISDGNDVLLYATLHTQGGLQVQEDGNMLLTGNLEMEELEVQNGQVLDLNGNVLTVDSLASFGQIIDSVGGGGVIVTNIEITGNEWLPILDSTGCYRFYAYEVEELGTKTGTNSMSFGFALDFMDTAAYMALQESDDVQINVTLNWGDNSKTFAFSKELIRRYVELQNKYPHLRPYMKLDVTGIDSLEAGTVLTVTPTITTVNGKNQNVGDAITGSTPDAPAVPDVPVKPPAADDKPVAILSFSDTECLNTFTDTQQIWQSNKLKLTYSQGSYASALPSYINPIRLYKGTAVDVEHSGMTKLIFRCLNTSTKNYTNGLVQSLQGVEGITAELDPADDAVVIVTFEKPTDKLTIHMVSAARVFSLEVYQS